MFSWKDVGYACVLLMCALLFVPLVLTTAMDIWRCVEVSIQQNPYLSGYRDVP